MILLNTVGLLHHPIIDRPTEQIQMIDIFSKYNTGSRQWTFETREFTYGEFQDFAQVFTNDILHRAETAYDANPDVCITIRRFSVPIHQHPSCGFLRDVLFVSYPGSQYSDMFSCVYIETSPLVDIIADQFGNSQRGLMSEYEILDLIEPSNDRHQRALIDTWFDIDNWFEILRTHEIANIQRLGNIVNGDPVEPAAVAVAVADIAYWDPQPPGDAPGDAPGDDVNNNNDNDN